MIAEEEASKFAYEEGAKAGATAARKLKAADAKHLREEGKSVGETSGAEAGEKAGAAAGEKAGGDEAERLGAEEGERIGREIAGEVTMSMKLFFSSLTMMPKNLRTSGNFVPIGLHPPLDGITNPKYKLLHFLTTNVKFCKEKKALAFKWDKVLPSSALFTADSLPLIQNNRRAHFYVKQIMNIEGAVL